MPDNGIETASNPWWQSKRYKGKATNRALFSEWCLGINPILPDHFLMPVSRYLDILLDFRTWELVRIRRQLRRGQRKTYDSRFLRQIDKRLVELVSEVIKEREDK